MSAAEYTLHIETNTQGSRILVLRFQSARSLEHFFIDLIGTGMMDKSDTKVIGTTLLIWDK